MKARDLAALAALGIAGKAAYDKYSEKTAPAKKKMGEGLDMTNQGAYELAARPRFEGAAVEKTSRQESDIPEALSRQERDVPDRIMGRDAAGSRFTDKAAAPVAVASPVRTPVVESRSLDSAGGPSRYNRAADSNAAGAQMPDAARVTPYNPDIMYNTTVARDESIPHDDEMNRLARTRATRQGAVVAQSPNAQAQARILRQGAVMPRSAVNAQAQARMLRQGAPATRYAKGGMTSSKPSGASRGDGIAQRGRTRGKYL